MFRKIRKASFAKQNNKIERLASLMNRDSNLKGRILSMREIREISSEINSKRKKYQKVVINIK